METTTECPPPSPKQGPTLALLFLTRADVIVATCCWSEQQLPTGMVQTSKEELRLFKEKSARISKARERAAVAKAEEARRGFDEGSASQETHMHELALARSRSQVEDIFAQAEAEDAAEQAREIATAVPTPSPPRSPRGLNSFLRVLLGSAASNDPPDSPSRWSNASKGRELA